MAETVTMPKLGFDMAEGTLVRWVIAEGEQVAKGAVLAEIETDKATVEVESAYEGVVARHLVKQGDIVPVNTPIAIIAAPGEQVDLPGGEAAALAPVREAEAVTLTPVETRQPGVEGGRLPGGVRASPLARKMAAEIGLPLQSVPGSGPKNRILKRDVEAFLQSAAQADLAAAPDVLAEKEPLLKAGQALVEAVPWTPGEAPPDQVVPLSRLRTIIGRRMTEAKQQLPHFYVTHEYDVAALLELRKEVNALLPEAEKVSVNDFVVRGVALALRQFPNLNASLDGDSVIRHGRVNIGVAVALESGLLTVVCRDADRKSVRQISIELKGMVERARLGKVRPEDIEGSTFSVSNLGMYDVEHFIAIINPPEAAILAVGSAREMPVVENGELKAGVRMKATLSVDHRVSDGAEAARFLQKLAEYIEEPLRLLI